MSVLVLNYDFSVAQTEPPTSNQIRFDDSLYANVTKVWVRNLTNDGADMHAVLLAIPVDTTVHVQDKNDSTTYGRFRVTAFPVDKTSYVELPVVGVDHGSSLINNQAVLALLITDASTVPPTGPPGSTLVPLSVVKDHLHVTDTDHDDDITRKQQSAEAAIQRFLKTGWDDSWSTATLPRNVEAAILILTANLYEDRGDAKDIPDPWVRIQELLVSYRDPALA